MNSKKNKYFKSVLALLILASCSTTSENLITSSDEYLTKDYQRDLQDINAYNGFFVNDLKIIQQTIDNQKLSPSSLQDLKLLKRNYQKILKKNKYQIKLHPRQRYSEELIKLVYQFNLPVSISWDENNPDKIPKDLLIEKIDGFCSSLFDESILSINNEISKNSGSILVIYSDQYAYITKKIKSENSRIYMINYESGNFQEFTSKILGIDQSESRFKKISNLNPNQVMNFKPRSRSDIKQIVMLLKPNEFKSMIPALRYHGGDKFKYINFISSLEGLNNSMQLMDYEDSHTPISVFLSNKIHNEGKISFENFLERGLLSDWLLSQVLEQAGVQSATIKGSVGDIFYNLNTCNRREVRLQKISSDLFSN